MKRYDILHCKNLRDIGGCPTQNGFIPYGVFYRSDAPIDVKNEEMERIHSLGITTVIDLRYEEEALRRPCALKSDKKIEYHNISLGVGTMPKTESEIIKSYLDYVENKEAVRQVFSILSKAPGAVLFHCTAGKDRTGIIAALLLLIANAKDCDIIADYQVSYTFIREMIDQLKRDNPELPAFAGQSKPEYMEGFLKVFKSGYPSIEKYLEMTGVSDVQLNQIKFKLGLL